MPELTDEQQAVFDEALAFVRAPHVDRPYFLYEALAGSGKTVVLSKLARALRGATMCAFTGKAASVLSRKSGMQATTIHSAIYQFAGETDDGDLLFDAKVEDGDWHGHVALVDESGTVDTDLARDLLATGCRVVACGDPGQLKPVRGERYFRDPNAVLRTVHRQAWDSPIVRQAHRVQATGFYAADGDAFRVERFVERDDILTADVILCWRNATRSNLNHLKRAHLGLAGAPVMAGEPLMCLRNDHKRGLLNGAVYPSLIDRRPWDPVVVTNERGSEVEVEGRIEDLEPPSTDRKVLPFCFGYAATVHKFQGSEADMVILVDEYDRTDDRTSWLYTGLTRAAKAVIVQRNW